MKILNTLFLFVLVVIISACSNPQDQGNAGLDNKIQNLENKIEGLQNQLEDQKVKTRISFMQISSNPIVNTPFEDFVFASDDFWKKTTNVASFQCSRRCIEAGKARQKTCAKLPDGQEKKQCYDASAKKREFLSPKLPKRISP